MAQFDYTILGQADIDTSQVVRKLNDLNRRVPVINLKINSSQPLGKMSSDLHEFDKSLSAATARVLAFTASTSLLYGIGRAFTAITQSFINTEAKLKSIQIVLNSTNAGFAKFTTSLFEAAKNTGKSFDEVADAAVELSRQGLKATEINNRLTAALILSRQAGLGTAEAVSDITAALNTFNKESFTAIELVNKLSNVDQSFAVSSKDLAESIKRAGASAQDAGVGLDKLIALTTSLQQTTARGGAVIGNALKSIFTRVERSSTLDALEQFNVQTRDLQGNVLSADVVLKNLANTYKDLSKTEQSVISERVAGIQQINQLKALLGDLARANSVYDQSLKVSGEETNSAIERNKLLNQTLLAQINALKVNATQFSSVVGGALAKPVFKSLTSGPLGVGNVLSIFSDQDEQSKSAGQKIGEGLLKGLGTALSGPGLILGASVLFNVFKKLGGNLLSIVGDYSTLNNRSREQANVQTAINQILASGNEQYIRRLAAARTIKQEEEAIRSIMLEQAAIQIRTQASVFGGAAAFVKKGGGISQNNQFKIPRAAEGMLPFAQEQYDINKGVGGASPTARPKLIPNFNFGGGRVGPVVANTDEYIVPNYAGGDGSAIYNQQMVARHGLPRGAQKINASEGFVPSYAEFNIPPIKCGGNIDWKSVLRFIEPDQFLSAAYPLHSTLAKSDTINRLRDRIQKNQEIDPAYLRLERDNLGRLGVTGHEGRHRATAALFEGVKDFPVEFDIKHFGRAPDLSKSGKLGDILAQKYLPEKAMVSSLDKYKTGRIQPIQFDFRRGGANHGFSQYANGFIPNYNNQYSPEEIDYQGLLIRPGFKYIYDDNGNRSFARKGEARERGFELIDPDEAKELQRNRRAVLASVGKLDLIDPTAIARQSIKGARSGKSIFNILSAKSPGFDKYGEARALGLGDARPLDLFLKSHPSILTNSGIRLNEGIREDYAKDYYIKARQGGGSSYAGGNPYDVIRGNSLPRVAPFGLNQPGTNEPNESFLQKAIPNPGRLEYRLNLAGVGKGIRTLGDGPVVKSGLLAGQGFLGLGEPVNLLDAIKEGRISDYLTQEIASSQAKKAFGRLPVRARSGAIAGFDILQTGNKDIDLIEQFEAEVLGGKNKYKPGGGVVEANFSQNYASRGQAGSSGSFGRIGVLTDAAQALLKNKKLGFAGGFIPSFAPNKDLVRSFTNQFYKAKRSLAESEEFIPGEKNDRRFPPQFTSLKYLAATPTTVSGSINAIMNRAPDDVTRRQLLRLSKEFDYGVGNNPNGLIDKKSGESRVEILRRMKSIAGVYVDPVTNQSRRNVIRDYLNDRKRRSSSNENDFLFRGVGIDEITNLRRLGQVTSLGQSNADNKLGTFITSSFGKAAGFGAATLKDSGQGYVLALDKKRILGRPTAESIFGSEEKNTIKAGRITKDDVLGIVDLKTRQLRSLEEFAARNDINQKPRLDKIIKYIRKSGYSSKDFREKAYGNGKQLLNSVVGDYLIDQQFIEDRPLFKLKNILKNPDQDILNTSTRNYAGGFVPSFANKIFPVHGTSEEVIGKIIREGLVPKRLDTLRRFLGDSRFGRYAEEQLEVLENEKIAEKLREKFYPNLPSRLNSVFLSPSNSPFRGRDIRAVPNRGSHIFDLDRATEIVLSRSREAVESHADIYFKQALPYNKKNLLNAKNDFIEPEILSPGSISPNKLRVLNPDLLWKLKDEGYNVPVKQFDSRVKSHALPYARGYIPNYSRDLIHSLLRNSTTSVESKSKLLAELLGNSNDPLGAAILREKSAGVPAGQIRVENHPSLISGANPGGLAVTNKIDEPGGIAQGISRAIKEGKNPKTYGASEGLIPNYAPRTKIRNIPSEVQDELLEGLLAEFSKKVALESQKGFVGGFGGTKRLKQEFQDIINSPLVGRLSESRRDKLALKSQDLISFETEKRGQKINTAALTASFAIPTIAGGLSALTNPNDPSSRKFNAVAGGIGTGLSTAAVLAGAGPVGLAIGGLIGVFTTLKGVTEANRKSLEEYSNELQNTKGIYETQRNSIAGVFQSQDNLKDILSRGGSNKEINNASQQIQDFISAIDDPSLRNKVINARTEGERGDVLSEINSLAVKKISEKSLEGALESIIGAKRTLGGIFGEPENVLLKNDQRTDLTNLLKNSFSLKRDDKGNLDSAQLQGLNQLAGKSAVGLKDLEKVLGTLGIDAETRAKFEKNTALIEQEAISKNVVQRLLAAESIAKETQNLKSYNSSLLNIGRTLDRLQSVTNFKFGVNSITGEGARGRAIAGAGQALNSLGDFLSPETQNRQSNNIKLKELDNERIGNLEKISADFVGQLKDLPEILQNSFKTFEADTENRGGGLSSRSNEFRRALNLNAISTLSGATNPIDAANKGNAGLDKLKTELEKLGGNGELIKGIQKIQDDFAIQISLETKKDEQKRALQENTNRLNELTLTLNKKTSFLGGGNFESLKELDLSKIEESAATGKSLSNSLTNPFRNRIFKSRGNSFDDFFSGKTIDTAAENSRRADTFGSLASGKLQLAQLGLLDGNPAAQRDARNTVARAEEATMSQVLDRLENIFQRSGDISSLDQVRSSRGKIGEIAELKALKAIPLDDTERKGLESRLEKINELLSSGKNLPSDLKSQLQTSRRDIEGQIGPEGVFRELSSELLNLNSNFKEGIKGDFERLTNSADNAAGALNNLANNLIDRAKKEAELAEKQGGLISRRDNLVTQRSKLGEFRTNFEKGNEQSFDLLNRFAPDREFFEEVPGGKFDPNIQKFNEERSRFRGDPKIKATDFYQNLLKTVDQKALPNILERSLQGLNEKDEDGFDTGINSELQKTLTQIETVKTRIDNPAFSKTDEVLAEAIKQIQEELRKLNPETKAAGVIPTFAGGLTKSLFKEQQDIARGVGGARPGDYAYPAFIKGIGPAVVNSGETIVRNFAGGKDAVINREMMGLAVGYPDFLAAPRLNRDLAFAYQQEKNPLKKAEILNRLTEQRNRFNNISTRRNVFDSSENIFGNARSGERDKAFKKQFSNDPNYESLDIEDRIARGGSPFESKSIQGSGGLTGASLEPSRQFGSRAESPEESERKARRNQGRDSNNYNTNTGNSRGGNASDKILEAANKLITAAEKMISAQSETGGGKGGDKSTDINVSYSPIEVKISADVQGNNEQIQQIVKTNIDIATVNIQAQIEALKGAVKAGGLAYQPPPPRVSQGAPV